MSVFRVVAEWTGFNGAPGYSVLHFSAIGGGTVDEAQPAVDAARAFFEGLTTDLPGAVRIRVQPNVDVLNEATGDLEGYVTVQAPQLVSGLQPGSFSGVSGACITWTTGEVRNGRRVRGRTFLVPLSSQAYEGDGTLAPATMTRLNAAAEGLRSTTPVLQVFARPTSTGATDGFGATVTGHRLSDKASILRSRRD